MLLILNNWAQISPEYDLQSFTAPPTRTHQENVSVKCIPPQTLLLYRKTGVSRGTPIFFVFLLQNIDCVPTIYVLEQKQEKYQKISTENFQFLPF